MKLRLPARLSFLILSIVTLFSLFHASSVGAVSSSKLGVFILAPSSGSQTIADSAPKVIKVMDPVSSGTLDYVKKYKEQNPDGTAILRVYEGTTNRKYSLVNPQLDALDFWDGDSKSGRKGVLKLALDSLQAKGYLHYFDYVSGPNEIENLPQLTSAAVAQKVGDFWKELSRQITDYAKVRSLKLRPLMGEIGVGNLEPEYIDGLVDALSYLKANGGAWSYHAYTLSYSKDVSVESFYSLRYRRFYDYLRQKYPDLADLPMFLTETGVDQGGNPNSDGWQKRGTSDQFKDWLTWFDNEIKKDSYIKGATIFQIGSSNWSSFDIEPIASWFAAYLRGQVGPVDLPPEATVSGTISPSPSAATCDSTFWENIRGKFADLIGGLKTDFGGKPMANRLEDTNKANLPHDVLKSSTNENCSNDTDADTVTNTAGNYNVATAREMPEQAPADFNFLAQIFTSITGIFNKGNEEAEKFLAGSLPADVDVIALLQNTTIMDSEEIAQNNDNSRVLGLFGKKEDAMPLAYPIRLCSGWPSALCFNNKPIGMTAVTPGVSVTPSPSSGSGTELKYNISYYKNGQYPPEEINHSADTFLSNASKLIAAVDKKWPTSMIDHWREIYDAAIARNWNPAFVLSIWIEETAASDACSILTRQGKDGIYDFGYSVGAKTYCSDYPYADVKLQKLRHQYEGFLGLYEFYQKLYKKDVISFEEFMCKYSEGSFAPCTFGHTGFVERLPLVYNCLINPNPSAANCPAGYFTF